jgi:hypothetical protein
MFGQFQAGNHAHPAQMGQPHLTEEVEWSFMTSLVWHPI